MRSHDTVSKFAYVSIFTYVSKCVHVNGALVYNEKSERKSKCILLFCETVNMFTICSVYILYEIEVENQNIFLCVKFGKFCLEF